MDNQNMMIEVTVDNDATQRCVGLLKELMAVQEKAMKFFVSEGIDDSNEGTMIAEGIGNAVKAFGGVLPEVYLQRSNRGRGLTLCVSRRYAIQQGVNNYRRYNYYKKGRALFALFLFFFSLLSFCSCEPNLFINLVHRHVDVILPCIFHKSIEGL